MKTPTTLDEAVDYLLAHMSDDDKKAYAAGAPAPHFTLGMNMRNEWELWFNETPLAKWFHDHGIYHGDDRSGAIFDALRARLKGEPFDIKEQADYYRDWWMKTYGQDHSQFGKPTVAIDEGEEEGDHYAKKWFRYTEGGKVEEILPDDPDYPEEPHP